MDLANRVAIVTGGGYGIGRQIALAYAKAGASVVIAARKPGPLEETRAQVEKFGGRVLVVPSDISKEADCAQMVERTIATFNHVDILVNNAGIAGATRRITEMTLAE
jgi:NAD(P)-dependent dehydrogenase (short-subunit alcohol dehydrogenase family)